VPKGRWNDIENRKAFFLNLAKKLGFDPNVPSNWANVSNAQLRAHKVICLFPPCMGNLV